MIDRSRSAFAVLLPLLLLLCPACSSASNRSLTVYCGAGLMHPMDELKTRFEATRPGLSLQMIYSGSGELFGTMAVRRAGDVFVPGSEKEIDDALARDFVTEESIRPLCYHVPVILIPADNPGQITCLDDMARPGLRIGLADEKAASIGKVGRALLKKNGLDEAVQANCVVRPSTVNQLLIYAATGQVDAVLAWEDQALWGEAAGKVAVVPIPLERNVIKTVPAAVVSFSTEKELAQEFVDFLASDEGKSVWNLWGFPTEKPRS